MAGPKAKIPPGPIELYDLEHDPSEAADVAGQHADIVAKLASLMHDQHEKSTIFPMCALDAD